MKAYAKWRHLQGSGGVGGEAGGEAVSGTDMNGTHSCSCWNTNRWRNMRRYHVKVRVFTMSVLTISRYSNEKTTPIKVIDYPTFRYREGFKYLRAREDEVYCWLTTTKKGLLWYWEPDTLHFREQFDFAARSRLTLLL